MDAPRAARDPSGARTVLIVLAGLAVLTGIVVAIAPGLDLAVASHFHGIAVRETMPRLYRAIEVARSFEPVVTTLAVAPAIAVLVIKMFWPKRPTPMPARAALFVILSLVLGPGLLVNAVLKDHWSRPRPGMVARPAGFITATTWEDW